jgi:hypothetical protein
MPAAPRTTAHPAGANASRGRDSSSTRTNLDCRAPRWRNICSRTMNRSGTGLSHPPGDPEAQRGLTGWITDHGSPGPRPSDPHDACWPALRTDLQATGFNPSPRKAAAPGAATGMGVAVGQMLAGRWSRAMDESAADGIACLGGRSWPGSRRLADGSVVVESEEALGRAHQPPFGAHGASPAAMEPVDLEVEIGVWEHRLDHRLAPAVEVLAVFAGEQAAHGLKGARPLSAAPRARAKPDRGGEVCGCSQESSRSGRRSGPVAPQGWRRRREARLADGWCSMAASRQRVAASRTG